MDGSVIKKRNVSEKTKETLRNNLKKARAARSRKAAEKKQLLEGNLDQVREAAGILRGYLMATATVYGDGRIDKSACIACIDKYVPSNNQCPCQDAWKFVEKVQEHLSDG